MEVFTLAVVILSLMAFAAGIFLAYRIGQTNGEIQERSRLDKSGRLLPDPRFDALFAEVRQMGPQ